MSMTEHLFSLSVDELKQTGQNLSKQATHHQRQAANPNEHIWVGASAGTGKTKVLTDRVLQLLLKGSLPHRLLCITFTKAAAAQMSLRINQKLAEWTGLSDPALEAELVKLLGYKVDQKLLTKARQLFAQVIDCPGGLKIQTIHSFCQSLLKRFPLEAGVSPQFEAIDEQNAAKIISDAKRELYRKANNPFYEDLYWALNHLNQKIGEDAVNGLLFDLLNKRAQLKEPFAAFTVRKTLQKQIADYLKIDAESSISQAEHDFIHDPYFDEDGFRQLVTAIDQYGSQSNRAKLQETLIPFLEKNASDRTADDIEALSAFLLTAKKEIPKRLPFVKAVSTNFIRGEEIVRNEQERLLRFLEKIKKIEILEDSSALLLLSREFIQLYTEAKLQQGALDFEDLILYARDLLKHGSVPWVLYKLDGGLDHLLVDEAQDTNPIQWELIEALTQEFFAGTGIDYENLRTLFVVGDEKQSIYSFQGADAQKFNLMLQYFREQAARVEHPFKSIDMDVSFRSAPAILKFVDAVFEDPLISKGVVADLSKKITHNSFRQEYPSLVELWPLVPTLEDSEIVPWVSPLTIQDEMRGEIKLSRQIAKTIKDWLLNKETIRGNQPVQAGDIMILLRKRGSMMSSLVSALKQYEVPVAGVDKMNLTEQLIIEDLLCVLRFILLPQDDLNLACLLKTPLIGLDEETLFKLSYKRKASLWHSLQSTRELTPKVEKTYNWLIALLTEADFDTPYEVLSDILNKPCPNNTQSGLKALRTRLGDEALDPLEELLSASLRYEMSHEPTLQGFVDWLEASNVEIKRELEQEKTNDGGMVRIMTVHGSKGLQAPIVFMPDTVTTRAAKSDTLFWPMGDEDTALNLPVYASRKELQTEEIAKISEAEKRKQDEEYRRLFYVAVTRAEDRLYICGVDQKTEIQDNCWYSLASQTFDRLKEDITEEDFISDPSLLAEEWNGVKKVFSHTPVDVEKLYKEHRVQAAPNEETTLPNWLYRTAPDEDPLSKPLTPSKPDFDDPAVKSPLLGEEDEINGYKRGNIIHRLLENLVGLSSASQEQKCRAYLAMDQHELSPKQQNAITQEVMEVLSDPDFAKLFSEKGRSEVPISGILTLNDRPRLINGVIDRLYIDDHEILIIDYKTNRPPPKLEKDVSDAYIHQLASYKFLLEKIYKNKEIKAAILWTDEARLMPISKENLDRFK